MSVNKLIKKSKKRIGNVHPVVWKYGKDLIKEAYKQGLYVMFSDGHRTNAEQNALYAQGRTKSGSVVTNARAGQSLHNYGIALDMFITNKKGTTASWNANKLKKAAQIAKKLGFEWGGDWTSIKDYPHIQMTGGLSLAQLQAGHKPNLKYKGKKIDHKPNNEESKKKWNKVAKKWTGQTLVNNDKGGAVKQLQKLVGVKADGYFGADTLGAVRRAQKDAGITVDGMAGKDTFKALNKKKTSNKGDVIIKGIQAWIGTTADGINGPKTKKTLITTLQRELNKQFRAGLAVDGIWGAKTAAAVVNIRPGSKGNLTRILQSALYLAGYTEVGKPDGIHGANTKKAVGNFQRKNGLYVDYIAGKSTFAKLLG